MRRTLKNAQEEHLSLNGKSNVNDIGEFLLLLFLNHLEVPLKFHHKQRPKHHSLNALPHSTAISIADNFWFIYGGSKTCRPVELSTQR